MAKATGRDVEYIQYLEGIRRKAIIAALKAGKRVSVGGVAIAAQVFDHPETWPEPETLFEGAEERPIDAGNVNATALGGTHYVATYTGSKSDAAVLVIPVQPKFP